MKGFTLIELLVVVLIIGILASVALPQYQLVVDKARFVELRTVTAKLRDMVELFYMANGKYPEYWADLDISIPGCTEIGRQYDLVCQKMRIDLNPATFCGWDSTTRAAREGMEGTHPSDYNYSVCYQFQHVAENARAGKFVCAGTSDRGRKLCKSLCGSNSCTLD